MMAKATNRRAWVDIDLALLARNVAALKGITPTGCRLMPALKADGYGLGAIAIGRALGSLGVDALCVATLEEGIALREAGINGELLILGFTPPECVPELMAYDLTQTVTDARYAALLARHALGLPVHLKLDTGMHRLGERFDNLQAIEGIFTLKGLRVNGIYTKLSSCESADPQAVAYTRRQLQAFDSTRLALSRAGHRPAAHAQCSYGLINYPGHYAYARPGAAVYGILNEASCLLPPPPIRPIFEVKARIAQLRDVPAGDAVGYACAFVSARPMRIAAITMGYADGLPRSYSDGVGQVLVAGRAVPIVGRVYMDQALIDVTGIHGLMPGDAVTFIGHDGAACITPWDAARLADTLPYELMCRLGGRLPRLYRNSPPGGAALGNESNARGLSPLHAR